jgi:membrane-bound lytic murein transglycosylase B
MKYLSFLIAVLGLSMPVFNVANAQEISCKTDAEKIACQQALAQVEAEQKQAAIELVSAQGKSASISRDIAVLDAKIKAAELDIKAKNILIQSLGNDISVKVSHIGQLEDRIDRGKDTLAQILRKTNEIENVSIPELILSQSTVSGLFNEFDQFQAVQDGLKTTFEQIRSDENSTNAEKVVLDTRRGSAIDAKYAIQQQQKNIENDKAERKQLLAVSKGTEKSYTTLIAQKQARAAQIRAALFTLRDAVAIPFNQALQFATLAKQKTGVRPAFLLAIITQESALGKNVGSCLLTDLNTGDGKGKNTGTLFEKVMKAPRDTAPFKQITDALGMDWSTAPVSCPIGGTGYFVGRGFGGAMGPAQFIASTWDLMKDRLGSALGISTEPDPWNPAHAFMASAMYLSDLGAGAGSYSSEIKAACRYYGSGGTTCTYGKSVMSLADGIQRDKIDPLQGL